MFGGDIAYESVRRKGDAEEVKLPAWTDFIVDSCVGLILGAVSVIFVPRPLLSQPLMRVVNLIAAPLVCGSLLSGFRTVRSEGWSHRADRRDFISGVCFGLGFSLCRYIAFQEMP